MHLKGAAPTDIVVNYIPPERFNVITALVILVTLTVGVLVPDIEFVLGMVGSTIGAAVCLVFPALMFMKLTSKNTTERLAAQGVLLVGIALMVVGTYTNLQAANKAPAEKYEPVAPDASGVKTALDNPPIAEPQVDVIKNESKAGIVDKAPGRPRVVWQAINSVVNNAFPSRVRLGREGQSR